MDVMTHRGNGIGMVNNNNVTRCPYTSRLCQGISRVLSRWNGLQLAIQNEWGGHDSLQKSEQLVLNILSWFCQFKASVRVEDLENLLHESLLFSFNTEIEDGSIEEVAEQLMIVYTMSACMAVICDHVL